MGADTGKKLQPFLLFCLLLTRCVVGHNQANAGDLQLQFLIERNRETDNIFKEALLDAGDARCRCVEEREDFFPEFYSDFVSTLEHPDARHHDICDIVRPYLDENINHDTWGRLGERTTCEPQIAVLCVLCAVSLISRGSEFLAIKYFAVALLTVQGGMIHCWDRSGWPFLVEDLLENFVRLVEDGTMFKWLNLNRPFRAAVVSAEPSHARDSPGKTGMSSITELSFRVGHALGLVDSLVNVWRATVGFASNNFGRFARYHEQGPRNEEWTYADICQHGWEALSDIRNSGVATRLKEEVHNFEMVPGRIEDSHPFGPPQNTIRVLNAFSGMWAPPHHMLCTAQDSEQRHTNKLHLQITSVDGSARAYLATLARAGWAPRVGVPEQCDVEELWRCFPQSFFEIVHVRNGIDHTAIPLHAILELVRATRPGGRILLWHWQNEHPERWKGLASGPHQWGFDLCPSANLATADACSKLRTPLHDQRTPLLWNFARVYNLTLELAGKAELLSARYEEDPRTKDSANQYVVFEFRRMF